MKVDVLILFEHVNRELESCLLLKHELLARGYSAHVAQIGWGVDLDYLRTKAKLIVAPACYDDKDLNNLLNFKSAREDNCLSIVNIHCEQLATEDALSFLLPKEGAMLTWHTAWGEFFSDALIGCGVDKTHQQITGSPRLDFFSEPFSLLSKSREELSKLYKLDFSKKWVLLIGNYSGAFLTDEHINELVERGYPSITEEGRLAKETYELMLSWYNTMLCCNECDNIEFIYRPHPSELISDEMRQLEIEHDNFYIIRDYSVRDWLLTCDIAVMWNSTSAIEAAYADIPIFSLRPCPISPELQLDLLENVRSVDSVDVLIETVLLKNRSDYKDVNSALNDHLEYFYKRNGGHSAASQTADFLAHIIENNDSFGRFPSKATVGHGLNRVAKYAVKMILHKTGLMKAPRLKIYEADFITDSEIQSIEQVIVKCLEKNEHD